MEIKLFDTKEKRTKEIKNNNLLIYSCGPTVYSRAHIGNMRAYVFADTLNRTLKHFKKTVKHVINITDVGHLTSDADQGEDKIEKSARENNLTAKELTKKIIKYFLEDLEQLNIHQNNYIFPRATKYIKEQIELIKKIEKEGLTYKISDGIYFDTSKYKQYGQLGLSNKNEENNYKRIGEVKEKRSFRDFALWKITPKGEDRQQEWNSPWGKGFPGWHIECSAMAMELLNTTIDIHTGGVDHIQIHHNNEIAQSECVTKQQFVNIWMHSAHLIGSDKKFSKSLKNAYSIEDLKKKGFNPISLRYLFLQSNYRTTLFFSLTSLTAAEKANRKLNEEYFKLKTSIFSNKDKTYSEKIDESISNDLNTAKTLAIVWSILNDKTLKDSIKKKTIKYADEVLGLLEKEIKTKIPEEIKKLLEKRNKARKNKDYKTSDKIRDEINNLGFKVMDINTDSHIKKR